MKLCYENLSGIYDTCYWMRTGQNWEKLHRNVDIGIGLIIAPQHGATLGWAAWRRHQEMISSSQETRGRNAGERRTHDTIY